MVRSEEKNKSSERAICNCPYCHVPLSMPFPFCQPCGREFIFCPQCQGPVQKEAVICPHCGLKLKK